MRVDADQLTNQLAWAVDLLRESSERHEAVAAVLGLLFWKRLSDEAETEGLPRKQADDARFAIRLPVAARWANLVQQHPAKIAEAIVRAQEMLEQANPQMPRIFSQGELLAALSPNRIGSRERVLLELLHRFQPMRLADEDLAAPDTLAQAFTGLLHRTATTDQHLGTSLTPPKVATLIASLLNPQPDNTIYDPVCGSGGLLAACVTHASVLARPGEVFGRERSSRMWALSHINLYFHRANAEIRLGDSLRDLPFTQSNGQPQTFDIVVANPPFSQPWDAREDLPFPYFPARVPLRNADYVFIHHVLSKTAAGGRAAMLMPHGVLFRSGGERRIRIDLLDDDCFEAVIGLAPQLFYGTNIAVCLLIFNRAKPVERKDRVLFVDASRQFSRDRLLRQLSAEAVQDISQSYHDFAARPGYSRVVTREEIIANDFDLSIARYVRPEDATESTSLASELNRLNGLLAQREDAERKMLHAMRHLPQKPAND
jgi:type I restriction enzyme M protein